jgi:uncharacterized protein (UPF0261 family)
MMPVTVILLGTLNTKGRELAFLRRCIEENGAETIVVDVSSKQSLHQIKADYSCEVVAKAAGSGFQEVSAMPKAEAARTMAGGASQIVSKLIEKGTGDAVVAVGGGSGTALGCEVLRTLPRGLPKIMISAVAASDMTPLLGTKDIILINAVVDICLNRILRQVFVNAAHATVAMARLWHSRSSAAMLEGEKPLVAATMYGVTEPCVLAARDLLETEGYEVLVFSGGGKGPASMEELALDGAIDLVMDITTTSLVDEVAGGTRSSGTGRLLAAGHKGLPQVVAPGALDMINFGPLHTVPDKFRHRLFYSHTNVTTLMRTSVEESMRLASVMAQRLNQARGPVAVLIPRRGFSKYDHEKGPLAMTYDGKPSGRQWYDPIANEAFIETLKKELDTGRVKTEVINAHINDREFAEEVVRTLLSLTPEKGRSSGF